MFASCVLLCVRLCVSKSEVCACLSRSVPVPLRHLYPSASVVTSVSAPLSPVCLSVSRALPVSRIQARAVPLLSVSCLVATAPGRQGDCGASGERSRTGVRVSVVPAHRALVGNRLVSVGRVRFGWFPLRSRISDLLSAGVSPPSTIEAHHQPICGDWWSVRQASQG